MQDFTHLWLVRSLDWIFKGCFFFFFFFFFPHLQYFTTSKEPEEDVYVLFRVGVWTRCLPHTKNWNPPLHALRTSLTVTATLNMRSLWLLRGLSILEMPGYLRCF
jgi:hypothetical protein